MSVAKSDTHSEEVVGKIKFANERELQCFLRVGQYVQNSSPCVNRHELDRNHPLIYEH